MAHYLMKFIFYTCGVIGLLLIAFVVAKNSLILGPNAFSKKKGNLEIEESLAISSRKTLHIVKAFNEKFLIASDANSTTLLAKLNSDGEIVEEINSDFHDYLEDKPLQTQSRTAKTKDGSVIKSMLNKLNN